MDNTLNGIRIIKSNKLTCDTCNKKILKLENMLIRPEEPWKPLDKLYFCEKHYSMFINQLSTKTKAELNNA